ncbi:MAG: hypothetical protein HYV93_09945, partial [Candidatus Rokubacteria bacterium]|nr:hypothetical protein [Candidatus Rokubacteria bacterium]
MERWRPRPLVVLIVLGVTAVTPATAQTPPRPLSDAECRVARERLAGHARLSEGVRRAVAARAAATPAQPAPVA